MHISSGDENDNENIDLMPLIDMVFLLLIFFLVATTIDKDEREPDIALAASSGIEAVTAPPKQIVVNIKEDGALVVGRAQMDMQQLQQHFRTAVATNPDQTVLIRADEASAFGHFASVIDSCHQAGINKHKIATMHIGGGSAP